MWIESSITRKIIKGDNPLKISLDYHPLDEPLNELLEMLDKKKLLTPMIGEKIHIKSKNNTTKKC
ncbi:MAG: hypothetical protein LBS14_02555 [Holosporaceae bacterium]|jgi:hypothetical protein|nr:hypothetical protein [Holosporaceae bacterium]